MGQNSKLEEELTGALAAIHSVTERAGLLDALRRLESLGSRFFEGREFLVFRVNPEGDLVSEIKGRHLEFPAGKLAHRNALVLEGEQSKALVPDSHRILLLALRCPVGSLLGGIAFVDLPKDADLTGIESLSTLAALALTRSRVMIGQRMAQAEMQYAWSVVRAFLPESGLILGDYELAGLLIPARKVGGDLYDYFRIDEGRFGFLLADATGKGTGPCLQVSTCRAYFRALSRVLNDLGQVAKELESLLAEDMRDDKFVTAVFGWVNHQDHRLEYINAGQGSSFRLEDDSVVTVLPTNPPLGTITGWDYQKVQVDIQPGELVAFFTDGWVERACGDEEYGEERLKRSLLAAAGRSARESLRLVYEEFETSCFPGPQKDDVTALLVRRVNGV